MIFHTLLHYQSSFLYSLSCQALSYAKLFSTSHRARLFKSLDENFTEPSSALTEYDLDAKLIISLPRHSILKRAGAFWSYLLRLSQHWRGKKKPCAGVYGSSSLQWPFIEESNSASKCGRTIERILWFPAAEIYREPLSHSWKCQWRFFESAERITRTIVLLCFRLSDKFFVPFQISLFSSSCVTRFSFHVLCWRFRLFSPSQL